LLRESCAMPDSPDDHRVTIRLSPELYTQLQARGRQGQPLAAIVRQALVEYLARPPGTPESTGELALTVAANRCQRLQTRKLTPRQGRALRDKHQRGVPVPALMGEYGISRASVFRYLQSDKRTGGG
jgi:hypothetical protein